MKNATYSLPNQDTPTPFTYEPFPTVGDVTNQFSTTANAAAGVHTPIRPAVITVANAIDTKCHQ